MVAGYDFEDKLEERIVLSGQSPHLLESLRPTPPFRQARLLQVIRTFAHKPLTQKGPASAIQCQAIRFKSTREQASCAQTHGDPKNLRQNLVTLGIISYLCTVISNL